MIIAAKSDYISKANEAYYNLRQYEEIFYKEAQIIDYVKCELLRNEDIDDFYIDGCMVSVNNTVNGYNLFFEDYKMNIEVYEKQIVGMALEAL